VKFEGMEVTSPGDVSISDAGGLSLTGWEIDGEPRRFLTKYEYLAVIGWVRDFLGEAEEKIRSGRLDEYLEADDG